MALLISPEVTSFHGCRRREAYPGVLSFRCPKSASMIRVYMSVKGLEEANNRVLKLGSSVGLHEHSSAAVKAPPDVEEDAEEEKRNYYLNMGYAVRSIREEFPALFYKEPSFDIYRDDIVFKDPLNTFAGIENYKSIFWALRFHGRMFFRALWIDIVSVWQPVDNMIIVRWTVHGIPRVPWESRSRFDGTSEYKLDKFGKIYEHRVHNIALHAPPKFQILAVQDMIHSIGCPSTPKPTYFEISTSSFQKVMPQVKFSGIGDYVSSIFTGASDAE